MQVIRAEAMGLCFGVRDALAVLDRVEEPVVTTIHGELVHNAIVLDRLSRRGFAMSAEGHRDGVPEARDVVITAHGISDRERSRLEAAGKRLIDTTCPLVARVHTAARALALEGFHILVIGQPGHVEVRGVTEDLAECDVVPTPELVRDYQRPRLGIICQTTVAPQRAEAIRAAIIERNPNAEVRYVDTICRPTRERQEALERLVEMVQGMVVVGGRNSNNTRELVNLCRARDLPTWHVQTADELDPEWFEEVAVVGLTAGTSTLDETIDAVEQRLRRMDSPVAAVAGG